MQYQFRYRGFDVSVIPADVPYYNGQGFENCDGVYCEVFADTDPERLDLLGSCSLAVGHDIQSTSEKDVFDGVRDFIDGTLSNLQSTRLYVESARMSSLAGKLIAYIGEYESPESVYDTLHHIIGMDDQEIAKCGAREFVPFFDRDDYAKTIADYLIRTSTENTLTGNWLTGFDEIEKEFGVNLSEDTDLLDKICDHLSTSGEVLCDLQVYDEQFDLTFYTDYCPYAEVQGGMNDMSTM